jgi:hypothetical protein
MHEQEKQSNFQLRTVEDSSVIDDADFCISRGSRSGNRHLPPLRCRGTSFVTDESDVVRNHDDDEREELFRIAE